MTLSPLSQHPFVETIQPSLRDPVRRYLDALEAKDEIALVSARADVPANVLYNLLWLGHPTERLEVVVHRPRAASDETIATYPYNSVYPYDVLRVAVMQASNDRAFDLCWFVRMGDHRVAQGLIASNDTTAPRVDLGSVSGHADVRAVLAALDRAVPRFVASCVEQRLLSPDQESALRDVVHGLGKAYLNAPPYCALSQAPPEVAPQPPSTEEAKVLRLWTDQEDYVIAESLDEVAVIMAENTGYKSVAEYLADHDGMKHWREFPADKTFRLRLDNGRSVEQVPCYFIQQYGKGHLASANE
ncbi:MAG: hypothetical protein IT477_10565 [Rhodanobacteraceae bacterium]|nr:hypothetical protein [Rhodanobacteraceae bacterium]